MKLFFAQFGDSFISFQDIWWCFFKPYYLQRKHPEQELFHLHCKWSVAQLCDNFFIKQFPAGGDNWFPLWEFTQLYLSLPWKQEHCIGGSWRFYCTAFHRSFTSVCDGGLHNKGAAHLFLFSLTFFLMPMLRKCALGYFPDSLWLWEMAVGGRWDKQHPSSWGELWLAVNCLEDPDLRLRYGSRISGCTQSSASRNPRSHPPMSPETKSLEFSAAEVAIFTLWETARLEPSVNF